MKPLLADRICDAACLLFALLTVVTHLVVALGGNGYHLVVACGVALVLTVAWWLLWKRRRRGESGGPTVSVDTHGAGSAVQVESRPLRIARVGGVAAGLLVLGAYSQSREVVTLWWAIMAILAAAAGTMLWRSAPPSAAGLRSNGAERSLWVIAAGCLLLTIVCHRPAADDAFYVNVAVTLADHPDWALLASDTMHGIPGLMILSPVYRVHSYELLNGILSLLTGIPAIACIHLISAGLAALLVPLCYARLFRILMPRYWLWGVIACLLFLVANGDVHRSYGDYAFVKLWQGKAIFVTAVLPLVYAYALRYVARPTPRRWLLLCAAQIAAVGLTATALWVAPLSAGLALLSGARLDRRGLFGVLSGVTASFYVVVVGLLLRGSLASLGVGGGGRVASDAAGSHLLVSFNKVLGGGRFELLAIATVLLTWAVWRAGLAQRFAIIVPLGAFVLILNPYLEAMVIANITGGALIQWRSLWVLPVPILTALMICSPLQLATRSRAGIAARVLVAAALAALVLFIPRHTSIAAEGGKGTRRGLGVRVGAPALKVPTLDYEWAAKLNDSVAPGATVIAPRGLNTWIPTIHHHAYSVEVRPLYTKNFSGREHFPRHDAALRSALVKAVSESDWANNEPSRRRTLERFAAGLDRFDVEAVCMEKNKASKHLRRLLAAGHFERTHDGSRYEIWIRSRDSGE